MEESPSMAARRMAARRALTLTDEALSWECEFDVFVASGPGGQHRNKTESGVRLTHPATGIVITATERRSQLMNKGAAVERLREKLQVLTIVPKPRRPTKPSRGAKERRLTTKKMTATTKKMRREKSFD